MELYLATLILIVLLCFTGVLLFGAPYLPTLKKQRSDALELLNLKPGQVLVELGCGDGRILKDAARQGIKSIGYELNPIVCCIAMIINFRYRKLVKIKCANFWAIDWPECDGIYIFLLEKYMPKLEKEIKKRKIKKCKIVSYAFKLPQKKISKQKEALYLYEY